MYIDINTLFTFEVSKSDDQNILAAIVLALSALIFSTSSLCNRARSYAGQTKNAMRWRYKLRNCRSLQNFDPSLVDRYYFFRSKLFMKTVFTEMFCHEL
jgi:hypothetical protein